MPTTRLSSKNQVTIPKQIVAAVGLEPGDILEVTHERSRVVISPKRLIDKAPLVSLTPAERKALERAQEKIRAINRDPTRSRGLTTKEIQAAIKTGLILEDQAYFWTEEWQKKMRQSERDVREGRVHGPFETVEKMKAFLKKPTGE